MNRNTMPIIRRDDTNALRDRPYSHQFDYAEAESQRRLLDADQRFLAALYRAHREEFPWLYEGRA